MAVSPASLPARHIPGIDSAAQQYDALRQIDGSSMMDSETSPPPLFPRGGQIEAAVVGGFRFGSKGTHTSRTIMFDELQAVFDATPQDAKRTEYAAAIVENNCLSKPTASTRRLTNQRLGELYGLDPAIPLFRVMRRLWSLDVGSHRLLAMLAALARDPLLAATYPAIIALLPDGEFLRDPVKAALRAAVGERLNDATLDKVIRNAASSWNQSGHLEGRTFKKRRAVTATPVSAAYALYLAHTAGFRGAEVFGSGWFAVLDRAAPEARQLALEAKRLGLIDLRMSGDVVELNLSRLDPGITRI